jgi:hypothetical protein
MTKWILSFQIKSVIIEREYFKKGENVIIHECRYEGGIWSCESDTKPNIDLGNEEMLDILKHENNWETDEIFDMISDEWELDDKLNDEEQEELYNLIEKDGISAVDDQGWVSFQSEMFLDGPLVLINEKTGEQWT